jgi:hypothetical protein
MRAIRLLPSTRKTTRPNFHWLLKPMMGIEGSTNTAAESLSGRSLLTSGPFCREFGSSAAPARVYNTHVQLSFGSTYNDHWIP